MTNNLPSTHIYNLAELGFELKNQVIQFNDALINSLNSSTLSAIRNSFSRAILVTNYGFCYVKISELKHLLRTGNSGAEKYLWQTGIPGYSSPASPYSLDDNLCISGPDFCGLIDARIHLSRGKLNLYLRYVRAIYESIAQSSNIVDLRSLLIDDIASQRNKLKEQRILRYNICRCEFTGIRFNSLSEVQFAHIESVVTSPLNALNIDNGVIILRELHRELTRDGIHDFAGMYDYCCQRNYSIIWAENFNL